MHSSANNYGLIELIWFFSLCKVTSLEKKNFEFKAVVTLQK